MPYLHERKKILQIIKWLHWSCIGSFVLLSGVLHNVSKYFLLLAAATTFYLFFFNTGKEQERFREIDSQTKNLGLVYFIFLLSIIPSIFLVENYWPGIKLWVSFAFYLAAFVIGRFSGIAESKTSERAFLYMLSFSLFIFSANVILRFFGGFIQPGGFGLDCGASTSYIAVLTIILWTLGFEFRALERIGKTICLVTSTIGAVALTLSLSRGPWLATVLVLIIYIIFNLKRDWKRPIGTFLLILVMFIALFIPNPKTHTSQIGRFNIDFRMARQERSTQSIAERLKTWKAAINMFVDHPVFGIGLCQFQNSYKTQYAPSDAIRRDLPGAHNNFLQFLSETGLLGISGFLVMVGYLLFSLSRLAFYKRPNYWLVAALLMILSEVFFHGMTDYTFYTSLVARIYFFVLGVAYAQGSQPQG
ncbi:MAG: O-antigen ligase family protein [Candidatus Omnitrophica bacterium]|nr:O-antigen ligase family protein [Candidatus Omnitrophota bacterium]MBU1047376.1 O-antigen ligase family protein [Candidatus Omnitrophota bacterium]MBU1630878.1 O-antigen ligase family protein [Candidatus Omnitrophota bacterium]MBU1766491.1 O-antigen ligase family protein [Candidatus Omnitrophota bacterium]MBU1889039.1 O-antigen ligase family protein [Candidatus Omnitrophota bacterium]